MTNATINFQDLNELGLSARRALAESAQQLFQTPPSFADSSSRTFSVTNGAIDVPGTAERFVTGVVSGQLAPAIRDIGINPVSAGAIAGGLDAAFSGASLQGALQGAVTGALNNAIVQSGVADKLNNAAAQLGVSLPAIPGLPGLGGGFSISGASGGAASSARGGITRSGTAPDSNVNPARTSIQDPSGQNVTITIDSFLQGLQGSLSSIAGAGGIGGLIGGMMNNLLSSTGLTGALGGLVSGLSAGLSNALGGLTNALGQAASGLAQGLGNAIKSIPGVGPAISGMSNAIGNFAGNLSGAYNNLSPTLQAGVNGAVAAVGANIVNKLDIPGVPRISPGIAAGVVASVSFANNPVAQLNEIATTARNLDRRTFGETRDPTFANVASAASRAAQQMQQTVQRAEDGSYQLIKDLDDANANINKNSQVVEGSVQPVSTSFVDNLNDIQLQSYETYARILRSKFISYYPQAPDLAVQAYSEYIEFNSLRTPETKQFVTIIETNDANLIKQLADRFLAFYRSDRSRYTLTNL